MFLKAVFPGKYIQGEGVLAQLPDAIGPFGKKGLILASPSAQNKILVPYRENLKTRGILIEPFSGECCEKELSRLADVLRRERVDVLVGMGGGKAIDTAKIAADRAGLPVMIVPTIASTDAPCSGCAVLYSEQGTFESVFYQKMNPQIVLVDTRVIAEAPARFLISGMGDALATWFEARSCRRTQSPNECGGLSTLAGLHLAKLCYDTLLSYGRAAKMAAAQHLVTPALNHIIEANILLSGLGFESSGLAAAHSIHNGLTALPQTHAFYHGEKVAFGVLAGLHLTDAAPDEIQTVYDFCEAIGLPTTFSDIGLADANRGMIDKAACKACASGECIHHEAGDITPEKVLQAMLAANAMGEARRRSGQNQA
ncbi:MAG TPA: glycerol dehydrogenase [Smithellaceae bacterium]|jgi:glycerol dehydrogenase|nr:glycerol dehydrogenase [Smithellaceae bacterium]HPL31042.1 glycerol dehydrogenase [Smithellaceae bacterium]